MDHHRSQSRPANRHIVTLAALLAVLFGPTVRADASDWRDLPHRRIVLVGTINGQWSVQLDLSFEGQGVTGGYFYTARGLPLYLKGQRDADHGPGLTLTEHEADKMGFILRDKPITGRWSIAPNATGGPWTGTWTSPDGKKSYRVALTLIAEYHLMARTAAGVTAQAETPRLIDLPLALTRALDGLADDTIDAANGFIAESRSLHAVPDAEGNFEHRHYFGSQDWSIDHVGDGIVSMHLLNYTYMGGAHPNYVYSAETYLLQNGRAERLRLADLFEPEADWLGVVRSLITDRLRAQEAAWLPKVDDPDYAERLSEQALSSFTLAPHGLTFYFEPYLFGPYAQGAFVVRVPWDELHAVVSPEGPAGRWMP